jgi:hypothetical protein
MIRTATLLLLLACAAQAADEDARFKPKAYVPSKPAQNRAYQAAEYAPGKALSAAAPATGKSAEPARHSIWSFFKAKPFENTPKLADAPAADAAPYAQSQQITVPTMTPDRKAINMDEHKPYIEGENKLQAAGYKPPEKPREKNPLLAPRQGIKEPQP